MSRATLRAEIREAGHARALRRDGYVPAVLYGRDEPTVALKVRKTDVDRLLNYHGGHGLLDLDVDGVTKTVMVREIQRDPVRGDVLHMDFYRVSLRDRIQTSVPIHIVGEEAITKTGAVVQHQAREIEIECLPTDIPEHVVADVSNLGPGDVLTVGQLQMPEGVVALTDPDQVVVAVSVPRILRAAVASAAGNEDESGASDGDEADEE